MDPLACREHLGRLLAEESACLARLEELLLREHELLVANDVAALEKAGQERQALVGALVRIEDERRSLCRMHDRSPDAIGLGQLLAWCDSQGTLRKQWAECAVRAGKCRENNDRNGALVIARMKRVESLLAVITRPCEAAKTYGPQGACAAPLAGRVFAAEA